MGLPGIRSLSLFFNNKILQNLRTQFLALAAQILSPQSQEISTTKKRRIHSPPSLGLALQYNIITIIFRPPLGVMNPLDFNSTPTVIFCSLLIYFLRLSNEIKREPSDVVKFSILSYLLSIWIELDVHHCKVVLQQMSCFTPEMGSARKGEHR